MRCECHGNAGQLLFSSAVPPLNNNMCVCTSFAGLRGIITESDKQKWKNSFGKCASGYDCFYLVHIRAHEWARAFDKHNIIECFLPCFCFIRGFVWLMCWLQPVGFVTFHTRAGAEAAKQDLQVNFPIPVIHILPNTIDYNSNIIDIIHPNQQQPKKYRPYRMCFNGNDCCSRIDIATVPLARTSFIG